MFSEDRKVVCFYCLFSQYFLNQGLFRVEPIPPVVRVLCYLLCLSYVANLSLVASLIFYDDIKASSKAKGESEIS